MASLKLNIVTRSLSSSAVASQMVKPPVQVYGIEGRYATALYSGASKNKVLDAVEKDLVKIQNNLKTDVKFRDFIANPTFKRSIKSNALKEASSKLQMAPATSNLLELLAENGRLNKLEGVINAYKVMMSAHRGEVPCEVTTAKPLDENQRKQLESTLRGFLKPKENLLLTLKVNPSILGGMVVSIGDRYVDMSVASKVKLYTEIISTPV
ncbi:ATP synthase subunit O, mitochondrial-like [Ctenocephalides felis]|uniref:ATP synthase subunit O, mitochondrial-like n=1 Tax=Ctenocephalides felis TaxID=7515 RepID=UPI000E6E204B|nr:ATP synthase subunit O, mitochondrial-like [Ctenocephalides felis]XP_026463666.1 ATP synthase subunit O, mitochondrial-like [Ctenocephalides felis]